MDIGFFGSPSPNVAFQLKSFSVDSSPHMHMWHNQFRTEKKDKQQTRTLWLFSLSFCFRTQMALASKGSIGLMRARITNLQPCGGSDPTHQPDPERVRKGWFASCSGLRFRAVFGGSVVRHGNPMEEVLGEVDLGYIHQ